MPAATLCAYDCKGRRAGRELPSVELPIYRSAIDSFTYVHWIRPALRKVTADVTDAAGLAAVVNQGSLVLSALGTDRAAIAVPLPS
jgi:hypothetical protein